MKKKLAVAVIVLGTVVLPACSDTTPDAGRETVAYFAEEYQVKNHTDGGISEFGLSIAPADEMGDWVVDWLADVSAGDGFQYFVYSDPDSWDAYLCYPANHTLPLLTNDDVTVEVIDGSLKVYVTESTEGTAAAENTETWVLHFAANPRGVWPTGVELYWNQAAIPCDAAKYST